MKLDLRIEAVFASAPDDVWRALTDPTLLGRWLMRNDFAARVDCAFALKDPSADDRDGGVACRVLDLVAPRRMVWSWNAGTPDEVDTRVVFELAPDRDACTRLEVRHEGEAMPAQRQALRALWTRRVDFLRNVLEPGYACLVQIAAGREAVFDAIGTNEGLERCWTTLDRTGIDDGAPHLALDPGDAGGELAGVRIVEARRPISVQWSCAARAGDSSWDDTAVTFMLADQGARGCELRVTHAGVPRDAVGPGWDRALDRLVACVEGAEEASAVPGGAAGP